jgi:ABC-type bacteriocin/lantibiotic exporter with double-glycine peptidase domain
MKAKVSNAAIQCISDAKPSKEDAAIVQMFTTEAGHLVGYFIAPMTILISEALVIVCILTALAFSYGESILFSGITLAVVALAYFLSMKKTLEQISLNRIDREQSRTKLVVEWYGLIDTIKISRRQSLITKKISILNHVVSRLEGLQYFGTQLPKLWLETIGIPLVLISVYLSADHFSPVEALSYVISVGLASFRIIPSLNRFLSSLQTLKYAAPVIDRFLNLMTPKEESSVSPVPFLELDGAERLFITGASGSGKTTVVKKLLAYDRVRICSNGKSFTPEKISYLSQEHATFSGTVKENIDFYCDYNNSDHDTREMLKKYNMDAFLEADRYKDVISPEQLSGGEKLRINLARIFEQPADLIVLDEPTNGLDFENVMLVKHLIARCSSPLIVITHDDRLTNLASRALRVEDIK